MPTMSQVLMSFFLCCSKCAFRSKCAGKTKCCDSSIDIDIHRVPSLRQPNADPNGGINDKMIFLI